MRAIWPSVRRVRCAVDGAARFKEKIGDRPGALSRLTWAGLTADKLVADNRQHLSRPSARFLG